LLFSDAGNGDVPNDDNFEVLITRLRFVYYVNNDFLRFLTFLLLFAVNWRFLAF